MVVLYVIFFFLILRFTVTLFNFISNPKLPPASRLYDDLVSVLIPVEHHSQQIFSLLQSIRDQDYKNYEVLIATHTDGDTAYDTICKQDQRFRCIRIPELPADRTAKSFICSGLSSAASGKYFIFLDPGVIIANGLINNAVHRMKVQRLALLSLFANRLMGSAGERCVVPLINFLLLNLVPLRLVRLARDPVFSAASSEFMMIEAENYKEYDWYKMVRNKMNEDIEVMKMIKGSGYHAEALLGNGFIYSRMYMGFTQAVQGLARHITAYFGGSIIALFLYVFLVILGPLAIAAYMSTELVSFAVTLIILSRIMISLSSGQNAWLNLIMHPVQMLSLVLVAAFSVQKRFIRTVKWKRQRGEY